MRKVDVYFCIISKGKTEYTTILEKVFALLFLNVFLCHNISTDGQYCSQTQIPRVSFITIERFHIFIHNSYPN